ncbi:hypothetical protein CC1G_15707 [Coprinopsis cinerea okayama7|uniref:Uncharacterized protein n=1 Tax=Coprinopsis cinerea (strain Okayama-7 / 130 / ATCC MYA-4618 / FGSC 9003) TaxID=240176 RepID=D6RQG8_COPC7|nr:hypothetical protein CC1G_15707 [Coprinopsis cinerea okayama7\|eukprot:XP_002910278.1 hypothetical protein CC1G_15707 [Coprinopsis cinerea okayama7\
MNSSSGRPPPPYNGLPPPIPSHLNQVNAAKWQAGYWQPNPHYNPMLHSAQAAQMMAAAAAHSRMQGEVLTY